MSQPNQTKMDNVTIYLDKISWNELAVVITLYVILLTSIISGNGLVLTAFTVNKRLRTATNKLVMGLAASDILVGFVSIPCWLNITISLHNHLPISFTVYQFYITFDIFIGTASILQLTSLSIERCHAIARPLRHRTLSIKVFYVLIIIPWTFAAIVATLQPLQYNRWREEYTLLMTTTCFFVPFSIICVAYLSIYCFARCKPIAKHRSERKAFKKDLRLSVTLAVITGLFMVAWLPLFVVTVIGTYYPQYLPPSLGTDRVLQFVKFCHYSNSALNPLVYACRNNEMIRTIRHIGHRLLCKVRQPPIWSRLSSYRSSSRRSTSGRTVTGDNSLKKTSSVRTCSIKSGNGSRRQAEDVNENKPKQQKNVVVVHSAV